MGGERRERRTFEFQFVFGNGLEHDLGIFKLYGFMERQR